MCVYDIYLTGSRMNLDNSKYMMTQCYSNSPKPTSNMFVVFCEFGLMLSPHSAGGLFVCSVASVLYAQHMAAINTIEHAVVVACSCNTAAVSH